MTTLQGTASVSSVAAAGAEPLPIVRASEVGVIRARELYGDGRLAEALRALDGIGIGDPHRAEADALRGDVQRDLLAAAGVAPPMSTPFPTGGLR